MSNIKHKVRVSLLEAIDKNVWYHGSPEVNKLEQVGGFTSGTLDVEYVKDMEQFNQFQEQLQHLHQTDEKAYHQLLNKAQDFKAHYKCKKPVFLSNDLGVAKTYADARRAMDYQNAQEGVVKVEVDAGKTAVIYAPGDRFRFIDVSKVKDAFVKAGISPEEFDKVLSGFNYYLQDKTKVKTDMIACIGDWFGFDTIDVVGVLDSYHGGTVRSTVRMVFDASSIRIIK